MLASIWGYLESQGRGKEGHPRAVWSQEQPWLAWVLAK